MECYGTKGGEDDKHGFFFVLTFQGQVLFGRGQISFLVSLFHPDLVPYFVQLYSEDQAKIMDEQDKRCACICLRLSPENMGGG